MDDPKRLLDDARAHPVERMLLGSARGSEPTSGQIDAIWSALSARLPLADPASAPSRAPSRAGTPARGAGASASAKAAALLAMAGIAGAWVVRSHARPGVPEAAPSTVAAAPPEIAPAAPAQPPGAPPPISGPAAEAPGPATAQPRRGLAPTPRRSADHSLQAETDMVLRSREDLRDGRCDGALDTLDEARARFPRGGLAEERETLSIEALACAGRGGEASARAAAFLRAYPSSVHAAAVRRFAR